MVKLRGTRVFYTFKRGREQVLRVLVCGSRGEKENLNGKPIFLIELLKSELAY